MGPIYIIKKFHVKPDSAAATDHIEKAKEVLSLKKTASFKLDSPSLVSFVLADIKTPYIVVCKQNFFDDVFSSFDVTSETTAGFPFVQNEESSNKTIYSYHKELFNRSSSLLSSNAASVLSCVVDERVYSLPLLYKPKSSSFEIKQGNSDIEEVLSYLIKNKYKKADCLSTPGTFVVRGGVLDVFS